MPPLKVMFPGPSAKEIRFASSAPAVIVNDEIGLNSFATFTVPPVSGHNGSDYGRVRGYNRNTGAWDQLAYQTTVNGVTLTNTMSHGIYTQLEFYYYTNHNCMYNKSNITYSVEFYFE